MTKRQRAQVVELLKCAADNVQSERYDRRYRPFLNAARDLELKGTPASKLARDAYYSAREGGPYVLDHTARFLEAAARVEEGSRP